MSDFTVSIERGSERRRIILSVLIEHRFKDLQHLDEKKFEVSDSEIQSFIETMTPEERGWVSRKYQDAYVRNANAALARLRPPVQPTYGRSASGILENLKHNEIGLDVRPIDPSKQ